MQILTQEPYEAPAISEIAPVTITHVVGETGVDNGESDDNTGGISD